MACTRAFRPTRLYYVYLTCTIALLSLVAALGMYLISTQEQITTLTSTVNTHDARIAAISEFVYTFEKEDIVTSADVNTVAATYESSDYKNVIMRACAARSPSDKTTVAVSTSLAHLVGKELFIPEIQYRVTVVSIEPELEFHPSVRVCADPRSFREFEYKRVTVRVVK